MIELLFKLLLPAISAVAKGEAIDRAVAGGVGVEILKAIVGMASSQEAAVARLEAKVDDLALQPYRIGLKDGSRRLEEAQLGTGIDLAAVADARDKLASASAAAEVVGRWRDVADVELMIASCDLLLGRAHIEADLNRVARALELAMAAEPIRLGDTLRLLRGRQAEGPLSDYFAAIEASGSLGISVREARVEADRAMTAWDALLEPYGEVQTMIGRQRERDGVVTWALPAGPSPPTGPGVIGASSTLPHLPLTVVVGLGWSRGFGVDVSVVDYVVVVDQGGCSASVEVELTVDRDCTVGLSLEPMTLSGWTDDVLHASAPFGGGAGERRFSVSAGDHRGVIVAERQTPEISAIVLSVTGASASGVGAQFRLLPST